MTNWIKVLRPTHTKYVTSETFFPIMLKTAYNFMIIQYTITQSMW